MARTLTTLKETSAYAYDSVDEFAEAIQGSDAKRLFSFNVGKVLGIVFIDENGVVHGYGTDNGGERLEDQVGPIYETIKKLDIPEVEGLIDISDSGIAYQIFRTEDSDNDENVQASFEAWCAAVRNLPISQISKGHYIGGPFIQFLRVNDSSEVIVDATFGNQHFVIRLDGKEGRTLADVRAMFSYYQFRDNQSAADWCQFCDR